MIIVDSLGIFVENDIRTFENLICNILFSLLNLGVAFFTQILCQVFQS